MTTIVMSREVIIAKCERCMSLILRVRENKWEEAYENAKTKGWKMFRFTGTLEEYKESYDSLREGRWSPELFCWEEFDAAKRLLRFVREAEPGASIRVSMEDIGPILKILDWRDNG